MKKMELALIILGIAIIFASCVQVIILKQSKTQNNVKDQKKKFLPDPTRRSKALTSEQQKELFLINKHNLDTLKTIWKNEHL